MDDYQRADHLGVMLEDLDEAERRLKFDNPPGNPLEDLQEKRQRFEEEMQNIDAPALARASWHALQTLLEEGAVKPGAPVEIVRNCQRVLQDIETGKNKRHLQLVDKKV